MTEIRSKQLELGWACVKEPRTLSQPLRTSWIVIAVQTLQHSCKTYPSSAWKTVWTKKSFMELALPYLNCWYLDKSTDGVSILLVSEPSLTLATPPNCIEVSGFQFNEVKAFYHDVGMDSEEDLLHAVLNAGLEPFLVKRWSKNFSDSFFPCFVFFALEKQYVGWWVSDQYCFESSPGFFWPWRSLARIMISVDKNAHFSSGKMLENAALCKQISYKGIWHPGAWTFAKSWLKSMRGSGKSPNLSPIMGYFQVSQVEEK